MNLAVGFAHGSSIGKLGRYGVIGPGDGGSDRRQGLHRPGRIQADIEVIANIFGFDGRMRANEIARLLVVFVALADRGRFAGAAQGTCNTGDVR